MIENIKDLGSELDVEIFRDRLYIVVLEHRKVEVQQTRSNDDVSSSVAPEVETLRKGSLSRIAIRRIERCGRRGGDREAPGLYVPAWISARRAILTSSMTA